MQLLLYDVHGWSWNGEPLFASNVVRTYWKEGSPGIQVVEYDTAIAGPWVAHMAFIGAIFCLLWAWILIQGRSFSERAISLWMLGYCAWQLYDRLTAGNVRSDGVKEWPIVSGSFLLVLIVCGVHEYVRRHSRTGER